MWGGSPSSWDLPSEGQSAPGQRGCTPTPEPRQACPPETGHPSPSRHCFQLEGVAQPWESTGLCQGALITWYHHQTDFGSTLAILPPRCPGPARASSQHLNPSFLHLLPSFIFSLFVSFSRDAFRKCWLKASFCLGEHPRLPPGLLGGLG